MLPLAELREFLLRIRVDALSFAALTILSSFACDRWARMRYGVKITTRRTAIAVIAVLGGATIAAEWNGRVLGDVDLGRRLAVLLGAAVIVALVLYQHVQSARFRACLRAHLQNERRAQLAVEDAKRANRAKSDFLVTMSHELRTPLNALLASADFLLRSRLEPTQRMHATTLAHEGTRLGTILNEVLDLRKIEEGRLTLDRLPFSPGDIARDVAQLFMARAEEKRVALEIDAPLPAGLLVAGDARRFRQVLVNLVDNAVKFTARGSVTLAVHYAAPAGAATAAALVVRVRDTGAGIAAEQRARLFGVFEPVGYAPQAHANGPGLGLALAQRLVALMGGELLVQSKVGEGTEFSFALAVSPIVVAAHHTADAATAPAPDARPRVLIVDDVAANRVLLQLFLEQQGFAADQACDGEDAVKLAGKTRYDAILMDLQMPNVDGYMAVRRIRAAETSDHRALILAVTGCVGKETRDRCLAAGMDDYFTKPLELRKFCRTVTQLLAARSLDPHAGGRSDLRAGVTREAPAPLPQIAE